MNILHDSSKYLGIMQAFHKSEIKVRECKGRAILLHKTSRVFSSGTKKLSFKDAIPNKTAFFYSHYSICNPGCNYYRIINCFQVLLGWSPWKAKWWSLASHELLSFQSKTTRLKFGLWSQSLYTNHFFQSSVEICADKKNPQLSCDYARELQILGFYFGLHHILVFLSWVNISSIFNIVF